MKNCKKSHPFLFFYFLFLTICISGCVTSEYTTSTQTQDYFFYSSESEISLGQNIHKLIAKQFELSNSPYDLERVSRIGDRIAAICDRQEVSYYFYVIDKDADGKGQKNAISLPGGHVYIFKDLLDDLDDEELAFVLAHEVGHVVSRHHIKKLQAARGYNLLMLAGVGAGGNPALIRGFQYALITLMASYSMEDEFNADSLASKYIQQLGMEPKAGIRVMEKLYAADKNKLRPISYFKTHPFTAQRIRNIKESLHLPISATDYINF